MPNRKKAMVSPADRFELGESHPNIADFLRCKNDWLVFLKCISDDNVDALQQFAKRIDWQRFLLSSDTGNVWATCGAEFRSLALLGSSPYHPFPSNPFFVAIFYGAKKCLLLMKESGIDFSRYNEQGFTAYHNLMGSLYFQAQFSKDYLSSSAMTEMLDLFHHTLFTTEQQLYMLEKACSLGMTPYSWGVYIGLARQVEDMMYQYSPMCLMNQTALGVSEHLEYDVSKFNGINLVFFTCPLTVLLDLYGESALEAVKELGIFQRPFFWRAWIEVLFKRNRITCFCFVFERVIVTLVSIIFFNSNISQFLKSRCENKPHPFPVSMMAVIIYNLFISVLCVLTAAIGIYRKERYRRQVGYPPHPRRGHNDMMFWIAPSVIMVLLCTFLLLIYGFVETSCSLFDINILVSLSGCSVIVFVLANLAQVICYMRLFRPMTVLMASLYASVTKFMGFIVLYLLLIGVFARMFQSNSVFTNHVALQSRDGGNFTKFVDSPSYFFRTFYYTFLASLNVLNTDVFRPIDNRIDLVLTHIFFVLFVPVLFINFVIGVLSSVVSRVMDHSVESHYLLVLHASVHMETTWFFFRKITDRILGPPKITLTICQPLSPSSKLLRNCCSSMDGVCMEGDPGE